MAGGQDALDICLGVRQVFVLRPSFPQSRARQFCCQRVAARVGGHGIFEVVESDAQPQGGSLFRSPGCVDDSRGLEGRRLVGHPPPPPQSSSSSRNFGGKRQTVSHARVRSARPLLAASHAQLGRESQDSSGDIDYVEFVDQLHRLKNQDEHTLLIFILHHIKELQAAPGASA